MSSQIDLSIAFLVGENKMSRFLLERRSGIIAIYDTYHPKYQETDGCHSDYPWVIMSWFGTYNNEMGFWEIPKQKITEANNLFNLLSQLDNSEYVVKLEREFFLLQQEVEKFKKEYERLKEYIIVYKDKIISDIEDAEYKEWLNGD